jgi:nitrate reductase gamma subunit
MDTVRFIVGVILPYLALGVFAGGMIYRIWVWRKLASPPITLFPAPPDAAANTWNTVQEAVLFKSLFRGDRGLWLLAWGFHVVLALILTGHLRVFTNADRLLAQLGMGEQDIQAMSSGVGGAAGVAILVTAVLLLVRRLTVRRAREISGAGDYFALLLIGAIVMTGNMMRFGAEHFDLNLTRSYFAGLFSFADVTGAPALRHNVFLLHMGLAWLLVMLLPFSKLLHFGGIFFTHQLIRKH